MEEDAQILISTFDETKAFFQAADHAHFTCLSVLQTD